MAVKETLPKVKLYVSISQHHHYTSVVDQLDSMEVEEGRFNTDGKNRKKLAQRRSNLGSTLKPIIQERKRSRSSEHCPGPRA